MNLEKVKSLEDLKMAKADFYGPNSEIKKLQMQIKKVLPEERKALGQKISLLKQEAEAAFSAKAEAIKMAAIEAKLKNEWIDVTYPCKSQVGLHPLSLVEQRFRTWFNQNGYYETTGSEVETDEYNFQRLNMGVDHPAREMHDSLYLNEQTLLRTHNTGFTARELAKNRNQAFAQYTIGTVYRNDEDDATHSHQFTQVDFVAVGKLSFPNLIWTLQALLSYVLEEKVQVRLRPSFFPFTEPSCEVDVYYKGKWMEVLGSGMLHQNVLKSAGYTNNMNGFAAGVGIERIAMMKYGINNIREFYKNDLRFLQQFRGGK